MKKILMLLFPIVCALLIIGCGNSGANENAKKYFFDEDSHYIMNDDGSLSNVEAHVFINDLCHICGVHESIKDMKFELISNETEYAIKECNYDNDFIVPSFYKGIPVTTIKENAINNTNLKIIIPSCISTIGENSFYKNTIYLEHDEIPSGFAENWQKKCEIYFGYAEGKNKIDIKDDMEFIYGCFAQNGDELLPIILPEKFGYYCIGIFDEIDGGNQYYDENGNGLKKWDKSQDSSLYIHWGSAQYNIQFNANGGDGEMDIMNISCIDAKENEVSLSKNTFAYEGKIFAGWSLYEDGDSLYLDESSVYEIIYDVKPTHGETINLYAIWKDGNSLIDTNTEAEITIMMMNGDGMHYFDLGKFNFHPDDIYSHNVAMIYAIAKEFNKVYPNIKINLYTTVYEPDNWIQEIENFNSRNGYYPDIFINNNMPEMIKSGLVADLSRYENDPAYKMLNESLLSMCNLSGFQGALPQYAIPWGVYVNRKLASNNKIPSPEVDWTWDDYTNFVSNKEDYVYYGCLEASMTMLKGAYIEDQLKNIKGKYTYVNFATDDFKAALPNLVDQASYSFKNAARDWTDTGILEYTSKFGNYEYYYFSRGGLLTLDQYPEMFVFGNTVGGASEVRSEDWDYYPRPALLSADDEVIVDNHVGVVLDPISIYNYCADDGNNNCSEAELKKMDIAYTFASYWLTSTDAWKAANQQQYLSTIDNYGNNVYSYGTPSSFPLVKAGKAFDEQMEIWYSTPGHMEFSDTDAFPGFAEVTRLWGEGKIYGVSDKIFPSEYVSETGEIAQNLHEIDNFGDESVIGVSIDSPNWYSTYTAFLEDYNDTINTRYDQAFGLIRESLITYYGFDKDKL